MAWISGFVRFDKPSENQRLFNGDISLTKIDDLVFHGLVTEEEGRSPVPGALVKVFARSSGGRELPLGYSYSSSDGRYLVSVNKKRIPPGTAAIVVRAVAGNPSQEERFYGK